MDYGERWDYFTEVVKQLETLSDQAPDDRELFALTMRAMNAINTVLEHFIPEREKSQHEEAARAAAIRRSNI